MIGCQLLHEVVINNTMPFFKMLFAQLILGETVGKAMLDRTVDE